jgi:hypothetical protein
MFTLHPLFTIDDAMQLITIDTNDCWLWQGFKNPGGYGVVSSKGRGSNIKSSDYIAHRYFYRHIVGDIPEGLSVLHKCDVRHCCNPEHLFLGTHSDNMKDMVTKGRQWRPVGEKHYQFGKPRTMESRAKQSQNHADVKGTKNPMSGKRREDLAKRNKLRPIKVLLMFWGPV